MKDAHSHITNHRKAQQEAEFEEVATAIADRKGYKGESGSIYKVPDKPKILQGKMTMLGLAITLAGMLGDRFGLTLPATETSDLVHWVGANWDVLAEGIGILIAAAGRFRIKSPKQAA